MTDTQYYGGMPENRIPVPELDLESMDSNPHLGDRPRLGQTKMRKRVLYIVAGFLALGLLITGVWILASRGGKQPYKVSLVYYKLKSKDDTIQMHVREGLKTVLGNEHNQIFGGTLKLEEQILAALDHIYHAEIELTDRHGRATRLSFGSKGLCEYAKSVNTSEYCGDMWEHAQELSFGEFTFAKKEFLDQMNGPWKPSDYNLMNNNCVHFTQEFIKQVSAKGDSEGLNMDETLRQAHEVNIFDGIEKVKGIYNNMCKLAELFSLGINGRNFNGMAEKFDEVSDQIVVFYMQDIEPLHVYHVKDPKTKSA